MTATISFRNVTGKHRTRTGTITLGTYASGGEAFSPSIFGLKRVDELRVQGRSGHVFRHDRTNNKLQVFVQGITTGATAAGGTTGTFIVDQSAAETAVRAQSAATSTTYNFQSLKESAAISLASVGAIEFVATGV